MVLSLMCGSRKYPYPSHEWSLEILRGWGISKAKIFKRKYEAKLEFPEGWGGGFKVKNHPWGRYGYFLEPHNTKIIQRKNLSVIDIIRYIATGATAGVSIRKHDTDEIFIQVRLMSGYCQYSCKSFLVTRLSIWFTYYVRLIFAILCKKIWVGLVIQRKDISICINCRPVKKQKI